jgi:mutator protein MutT
MATPTTPQQPVVAAGILVKRKKVLLCHRLPSREWFPDVWDLPGGHVEDKETPAVALVRELQEELGVLVAEAEGPCLARIATDEFDLRVWLVTEWSSTPTNSAVRERDEIGWFSAVKGGAFGPAAGPIIGLP